MGTTMLTAGLAGSALLQLQRADAEQFALGADQRGAAPVRVRGGGEQGLVEHVFPVAGELLPGQDSTGLQRWRPAAVADHETVAGIQPGRAADRQGRHAEAAQRLHQAEAGGGSKPRTWPGTTGRRVVSQMVSASVTR